MAFPPPPESIFGGSDRLSLDGIPSPSRTTSEVEDADDRNSVPEDAGERPPVHRPLTTLDAIALIINKMVGTGIFTGPPSILLYTGDRGTSIGLWFAGFAFTAI
ncbi:hypothetical protein F5B20DRAFT_582466 [Whalleya microplaca]|nr:hypothetical protein F5B20DRAFT_582466 [Whalleya microplaca]